MLIIWSLTMTYFSVETWRDEPDPKSVWDLHVVQIAALAAFIWVVRALVEFVLRAR